MSQSIIFTANRGYALTSSREGLIRHLIACGVRVVIATADDPESRYLQSLGVDLEPVIVNRGGFSFLSDGKAYQRLADVYKRHHPDLIHHFHAKPIILGSIAARRTLGETVRVINTITGLGHAFFAGGPTAHIAGLGYRVALPKGNLTLFQNRDDRALFLNRNWVPENKIRLIGGSGVDIGRFSFVDREGRSGHAPIIVMLGRLLRQKGIPEFAEVAARICQQWPNAQFIVAGEEDPGHPDALTRDWVNSQKDVTYVGRLSDVVPLLEKADLLLFPSYYREGLPRVVIEASATGLPTVAFDVPGVREAVRDGETGFLVSERNVDALTERTQMLLSDPALRARMGRAARRMAEQAFDIRFVLSEHLKLYRELGLDLD